MAPPELTPEQLETYRTVGYVLLKQWIPQPLLRALQSETEAGLLAQFPDTPITSQWMWSRASATPSRVTPTLCAAQELPEFLTPARQLQGDDVVGLGVDLNRYLGDINYHPDGQGPTAEWGLDASKFMIYLDPVRAETGCLHIVP